MTQPLTRRVYQTVLQHCADADGLQHLVLIDAAADDALDALFAEEPSLVAWCDQNRGLTALLEANMWASFHILVEGLRRGQTLEDLVTSLGQLTKRVTCVAAYYAVQQERTLPKMPVLKLSGRL